MKEHQDEYDEEEEEVEALIVGNNNANNNQSRSRSAKKLDQSKRKAQYCVAFMAVIAAIVLCTVGFLWSSSSSDGDGASVSTRAPQQSNNNNTNNTYWQASSSQSTTVTVAPKANDQSFNDEEKIKSPVSSSEDQDTPKDDNSHSTTVNSKNIEHEAIVAHQIENFRTTNNNSLMINFHITHHGGTTFCSQIGRALQSPSFACLAPRDDDHLEQDKGYVFPKDRPWSKEATANKIETVTHHFNMISWEFKAPPKAEPWIPDTDWENPNLVSVIVMRDPISRLLAGDGSMTKKYPTLYKDEKATRSMWWQFAHEPHHTNNYALSILAGNGCCDGNNTDPIHLERAKELVSRFTFVLDIRCLDAGMQAMADQLGMDTTIKEKDSRVKKRDKKHSKSDSERIGYPDVYEYLLERNKLDIELYEWSKSISVVDCDALEAEEEGGR